MVKGLFTMENEDHALKLWIEWNKHEGGKGYTFYIEVIDQEGEKIATFQGTEEDFVALSNGINNGG